MGYLGNMGFEDMSLSFTAWWYTYPTPLKNHGVKVSWDDFSIPKILGKS